MYIKTERLELKPLSDLDCNSMMALFTNDEIKKTYMLPDFETKEQAEKLFLRMKENSISDSSYLVGIYFNQELIGFANEVEREENKIELGYVIDPKHHNHGYATEMLIAMIEELFSRGFLEVVAGAFEENPASMRVMEKSGMKRLDKVDEIEYRGVVHKCVYYSRKCC